MRIIKVHTPILKTINIQNEHKHQLTRVLVDVDERKSSWGRISCSSAPKVHFLRAHPSPNLLPEPIVIKTPTSSLVSIASSGPHTATCRRILLACDARRQSVWLVMWTLSFPLNIPLSSLLYEYFMHLFLLESILFFLVVQAFLYALIQSL